MERRLAAILAADVVGYSRLMGEDEVGTLARLKGCRKELIDPAIEAFHGRIVKLMGDGALVEFASVVDAVQCAAAIQRGMASRNQGTDIARQVRFRIGVNLGDIIVEGSDLYGDGVNIAARLEAMAEPGGICISGTAFDHAAHKVDVGLVALGAQQLKNIADPVRVYRVLLDPGQSGKIVAASRRPPAKVMIVAGMATLLAAIALIAGLYAWQKSSQPQRPSIAVLPFENLSGDAKQEYFADGITDDLITNLAKLSGLDVIARNSVFAYKGRLTVLEDVARDLGVRYVVEGSVRQAGEQIRVNVQLSDVASKGHLWADQFDRSAADIFAVQDEMTRHIAQALGVQLTTMEQARITRPPTANLEAYDYFLRAEQAARTGLQTRLREALTFYERAVTLDPSFAEAYAADARTSVYIWRSSYENALPIPLAHKRAYEKAGRALELNSELSLPYAVLAILQVADRRYEEAMTSARRAVALGPGDAEAQVALGYVLLFAGHRAEAATALETALRLDPDLPALDRQVAGLIFFLQGENDRAIDSFERARNDAPGVGEFFFTLAAAYVGAGRMDDARAAVAEGLRLNPVADSLAAYRNTNWHFRNPQDLEKIVEALRQAGLPEWRFGFKADERDRLMGEEIARLVLGRTLRGRIEPGLPAIMQIASNGKGAFRSATKMVVETVFVEQNRLCEQTESFLGIADCGPVYRSAGPFAYTYVNASKVFHFAPVP